MIKNYIIKIIIENITLKINLERYQICKHYLKKNDISPTKFYIKIETPNDKNDLFLVL